MRAKCQSLWCSKKSSPSQQSALLEGGNRLQLMSYVAALIELAGGRASSGMF